MRTNRARSFEFDAALAEAYENPDAPQPLCVGRSAEFTDYDEGSIPDEEAARALCEDCPLLDICGRSARAQLPEWGVQGGLAWVGGKQWKWLVALGHVS